MAGGTLVYHWGIWGICQEEAFLNSLPSKFLLPTTIFSHSEDPYDRKCKGKEIGGGGGGGDLYIQK